MSSHSESEALFHEVETLSHTELILSSLSFKDYIACVIQTSWEASRDPVQLFKKHAKQQKPKNV